MGIGLNSLLYGVLYLGSHYNTGPYINFPHFGNSNLGKSPCKHLKGYMYSALAFGIMSISAQVYSASASYPKPNRHYCKGTFCMYRSPYLFVRAHAAGFGLCQTSSAEEGLLHSQLWQKQAEIIELRVQKSLAIASPEKGLLRGILPSRKLTWKPKKGPIKTTVPLKRGYMGFHVSLGECRSVDNDCYLPI